jgi:high-affinity iron transporter
MRFIAIVLFAVATAAYADTSPQTIVHLLDYIGVDYPQFVKDRKVLDASEYQEQQEFAAQVLDLIGKQPQVAQRAQLLEGATALKRAIDAKDDGAKVAALAGELRRQAIDAYRIAVVPRGIPDMKRGAALYAASCASCHGAEGRGDGPASKGLDPAPANFHDRARMVQRSVYGLYNTISLGVAGTSMPPCSSLGVDERWALAFHVAALGADPALASRGRELWSAGKSKELGSMRVVATATPSEIAKDKGPDAAAVFAWLTAHPEALAEGREAPVDFARRTLRESVAAYKVGRRDEAQRLALNAYLEGFELAEASLDAIDRNLRQEVEAQMIAYRDALRRAVPADQAAHLADRIDGLLAASADKLGGSGLSPSTAAVSAFFILVREGLEALLVVAAIIAFLIKSGRREALPWIHAGWVGALALGAVTWFVASTLIDISGATRELTEGFTALAAAAILLYAGFWLHDKSHAQGWKRFIERYLKDALQKGTLWTLAGLSFLAVYREAFETVLFYQALWQQAGEGAQTAILGGAAGGAATLGFLAWLILRYGVRLPVGLFFSACSALMAVLAFAFTGHGVKALQEAGMVPASPLGTFSFPALGLYPTTQSLAAQAFVLILICLVYAWVRVARTDGVKA